MQLIAFYLLKVIACSGILLLYYRLALRNKRFHYYNRFYLLATIAASILLPLLDINWFTIQSSNDKAIALLNVIYVQGGPEAVVGAPSGHFSINWQQAPLLAYSAISLAFAVMILWRVRKIYAFKKKYQATSMGEFDFINTDLAQAPFSFLQNLFWRNDIDMNETTGKQILQHELTHIRQKHSWDKLAMQLVLSVFWANPFYWFIQKELYLLHEFIADEKAIENNDGAAFAAMLLTSQYGQQIFAPGQSFAYSPIKRRLYMLTNLAKPRYSYARRLMVLPLLASVIMLFAFRLQKAQAENTAASGIVETKQPFKVIIDAGHGGSDFGIAYKGKTEKDIVLTLAEKIKAQSSKYNVQVVLTRTGDFAFSEAQRLNLIEGQNARACISLHLDYASTGSAGGIDAYVSRENKQFTESKILGSAVLQSLAPNFTVAKTLTERQLAPMPVLKSNPLPAILLQCGTLANAADFKNITDGERLNMMADGILQGIAAYANRAAPATGSMAFNLRDDVLYGGFKPKGDTTPKLTLSNNIITLSYVKDTGRVTKTPLIVVDGTVMPDASLNTVNPDDIESIQVLKDETATRLYGNKGANGVVEIYTKSGSAKNVLLVLDGKEVPYATIHTVSPNDIDRVDVLKGETAVKQYGDKGANGVIQVYTKKGAANAGAIRLYGITPTKMDTVRLKADEVRVQGATVLQLNQALPRGNDAGREVPGSAGEVREIRVMPDTSKVRLQDIVVVGHPLNERRAIFVGGQVAWVAFVAGASDASIFKQKGAPAGKYTVNLEYTVDEDGTLTNIKALNNPGYGTADEALRIMKKSPKWNPAVQNGKPVKVTQQQTISFLVP